MKTLAAIKNELFKDYLKIVSTDNLEATLDNPLVPVPFTCVSAVTNTNADALVVEINKFFESKKIKNKDFLALDEDDTAQLQFLFNLIQISTTGLSLAPVSTIPTEAVETKPVVSKVTTENVSKEKFSVATKEEVEIKVSSPVAEPVAAQEVVTEAVTKVEASESFSETVGEMEELAADGELIESLGIPKNSIVTLVKDEKLTAKVIDEKTIEFDGETLAIVEGTKKAFKKAGVTGMALGLANWNYNGQSLKSLKDNK